MNTKIVIFALIFSAFQYALGQDKIDPQRKEEIDTMALFKVRDLSKYISLIGNKETPWAEATRVIDRAVELFMEGSTISVSSLKRDKITDYKVREYFERLMRLNYDKVTIEWFKIEYVSDLEQQPDGTFVGVITIFQRFKGENKDGSVYVDVTKKDITIFVKRKETQINGIIIGFWDVLLGDIQVKETSKK